MIWNLVGGVTGAIRVALGVAAGAGALLVWTNLVAVPNAVREAEVALAQKLRADAAEATLEAIRTGRDIEKETINETDEALRCIIANDCDGVLTD